MLQSQTGDSFSDSLHINETVAQLAEILSNTMHLTTSLLRLCACVYAVNEENVTHECAKYYNILHGSRVTLLMAGVSSIHTHTPAHAQKVYTHNFVDIVQKIETGGICSRSTQHTSWWRSVTMFTSQQTT